MVSLPQLSSGMINYASTRLMIEHDIGFYCTGPEECSCCLTITTRVAIYDQKIAYKHLFKYIQLLWCNYTLLLSVALTRLAGLNLNSSCFLRVRVRVSVTGRITFRLTSVSFFWLSISLQALLVCKLYWMDF